MTAKLGLDENVNIHAADGTALTETGGALDIHIASVGGVTVPISAVSLPLPSGAATAANQLPDGHNVTIDNASITVDGELNVNLQDGAGTDLTSTLISGDQALDVNIVQVIPGTGATALGKAEDDPHTSGDVGVMALGVRTNAAGTLASSDGDYNPFQIGPGGGVKFHEYGPNFGLPNLYFGIPSVGSLFEVPSNVIADPFNVRVVGTNATNAASFLADLHVSGAWGDDEDETAAVATSALNIAKPIKVGGRAWLEDNSATRKAAVTSTNYRTDAAFDRLGYQHVKNQGVLAHGTEDASTYYPVKVGGVSYLITGLPSDVASPQIANFINDLKGIQFTKNLAERKSIALTALNDTYDDVTTTNSSADFTTTYFRAGGLLIQMTKSGTPGLLEIIIEPKSGSNYFRTLRGPWARQIFDDTVLNDIDFVYLPVDYEEFPVTDTARITINATLTTAINTFTVDNAEFVMIT